MPTQDELYAEAYRRGLMNPRQKAAYEEGLNRGIFHGAQAQPRNDFQRLADNFIDGASRNLLPATWRRRLADPNAAPNFLESVLSGVPGYNQGIVNAAARGVERSNPGFGARQVAAERARRARFEAISRDDPWYRAPGDPTVNLVSTLGGQVLGGVTDPTNWIGGGQSLLARMTISAATNAGTDFLTQKTDQSSGVQDGYDPWQTAAAGFLGLGIEGARSVAPFVARAFTGDPPPRPKPVVAPEGLAVHPEKPAGAQVVEETPAGTIWEHPGGEGQPPTRGFTPTPDPTPAPPKPLDFVKPVEPVSTTRRIKAKIDEKGVPGAVADYADSFYTAAINEQHPIVSAVERLRSGIEATTGKPLDIAPSEDPRKLARGGYDVRAIGMQDIMHGVHGYRQLDPETSGLGDVMAAVRETGRRAGDGDTAALKAFDDYLTARRGVEEWGRRERGELDEDPLPADRGGDRANLEAHIAEAEKANPHFVEMATKVNDYAQALWKKALDAGLIDREAFDAANAARTFYVPFRRVMDETARVKGSGKSGKGPVAKRFEGSQRDVVGPLETLIQQTFELNRRIRQNDINLSMVKMAESLDALGVDNGLLKKIKTPNKPITLKPEELARLGIDGAFDPEAATIYRPGELHDGGKAVIYAWRDGKREAWEITDPENGADLFNALTGMSDQMRDLVTRLLAVPSSVLRAGVTTNPEFLLTNFVRDQMTAWIVTDVGFKPGEGAKGVVDELTGAPVARRYNVAGGLSGGANAASIREAADQFEVMALADKGLKAKYFKNLQSVLQLTEITETGTRLRLFELAFKRAKKEGMTDYDALIEASYTARDYLDFGRNGSRMAAARKVITFLNATLQGLDKTARVLIADPIQASRRAGLKEVLAPLFQNRPGVMRREDRAALKLAGKAWAKVSALAVFSLALSALYADDEEYQNITEYVRSANWMIKLGGGKWAKIPKPFDLAIPANIVERAYEAAHFGDVHALDKLVRGVWQTLALPDNNPLTRTATELATNTNLTTGGQIVPESKQGLLPQDQYSNWTSTFGRTLGKAVGVSPAMIDHAVLGFGGSWGAWFLKLSNMTDPDRPDGGVPDQPMTRRFVTEFQRGAQDKTTFFERVGGRTSELTRMLNSITEREKSGRPGEAQLLLNTVDEPGRYWLMTQMADGKGIKPLHPLARAAVVNLEVSRMVDELYGGRVKDKGLPLPRLTQAQKGEVQDALERLSVAETRNAMIASHQPGYENRAPMDRQAYVDELNAVAPGLYDELNRRIREGRDKAYSYDAVMALWPRVEARLKQDGGNADLGDLADEAADRSAE